MRQSRQRHLKTLLMSLLKTLESRQSRPGILQRQVCLAYLFSRVLSSPMQAEASCTNQKSGEPDSSGLLSCVKIATTCLQMFSFFNMFYTIHHSRGRHLPIHSL